MPSDAGVTINIVPPTPESTVAPQARPLSALTREELGRSWSRCLRDGMAERRSRRGGGTLDWLRRADVEQHLAEFRRRMLAERAERATWALVAGEALVPCELAPSPERLQ